MPNEQVLVAFCHLNLFSAGQGLDFSPHPGPFASVQPMPVIN